MKKLLARSNNLEADRRRLLDRLRSEIGKSRVMEAISRVQREAFVPQNLHDLAYLDAPSPYRPRPDHFTTYYGGNHDRGFGTATRRKNPGDWHW